MQIVSEPVERFSRWLEREAGIAEARIVRPLTGGNANVTSLVETADGLMVLRHPPADTVSDLAGAGIAREYRFVAAIAGKAPVGSRVARVVMAISAGPRLRVSHGSVPVSAMVTCARQPFSRSTLVIR